jgi:TRAP-type C4-dicarboxylate transport system substrate-binding protein
MKRTWLAVVLAMLVPVLAWVGEAVAQQTLKAVAVSRPTPQFQVWAWFAEAVQQRTNGKLRVDLTSLPEVGLTGFEMVRVMRSGLLDFADVLGTYVGGEIPLLEAPDLPGLYPDYETAIKSYVAFLPGAKKYEDKIGGVILGLYLWPQQVLFSRKPIRSLEDLKGMKVRVFGPAQTELIKTLGAEPVSLAFAEVYTALERGTVDASLSGTYSGFSLKWYEVSKHLVDMRLGPVAGYLVVSKRTWDRLSPENRQVLVELGQEFTKRGLDIGRQSTANGFEENGKKGMDVSTSATVLSRAVREANQRVIVPSWVQRAGPDAKAVFNQYIAPYAGFQAR